MERKGGGQGTRANAPELCSWETGILDALQPDSNPSEEGAKSLGPQALLPLGPISPSQTLSPSLLWPQVLQASPE